VGALWLQNVPANPVGPIPTQGAARRAVGAGVFAAAFVAVNTLSAPTTAATPPTTNEIVDTVA
jgi:hypothetical protein